MNWIEPTAVVLGLICVALTVKQHIACWPTGLAMTVLYVVIFGQARLYSDMGLQVVYIGLQIYGWWHWVHGRDGESELPVVRVGAREAALWLAGAVIATLVLGTLMDQFTDADLAYPDATTTVLSLLAQWWMARKVLQSWLVWITVDVLSIGIYLTKALTLTAGLYTAFLVLATMGYFAWRKSMAVDQ